MTTNQLFTEMDNTLTELLQLVSSFKQEQIDVAPFEGSWTAGQVAEHLVISGSGFVELINGPVKETERKPDAMAEDIKTGLLDFDAKFKSPEFVLPQHAAHKREELLSSLEGIRAGLLKCIETLDLTKTCMAFEIPALGLVTRLEALYFVLYHTQRHVHQLKNIRRKVTELVP